MNASIWFQLRLNEILGSGKGSKERHRPTHILLLADESCPDSGLSGAKTAEVLDTGTATIERVRKLCVWRGLGRLWNARFR